MNSCISLCIWKCSSVLWNKCQLPFLMLPLRLTFLCHSFAMKVFLQASKHHLTHLKKAMRVEMSRSCESIFPSYFKLFPLSYSSQQETGFLFWWEKWISKNLKVWWSVLIFETFPQSKRLFFYRSIALFCNFSNLGMIHIFMCEPSTVPKWIVHLQNKTVPNLMSFQTCDFLSPLKNKRKYFKECC